MRVSGFFLNFTIPILEGTVGLKRDNLTKWKNVLPHTKTDENNSNQVNNISLSTPPVRASIYLMDFLF